MHVFYVLLLGKEVQFNYILFLLIILILIDYHQKMSFRFNANQKNIDKDLILFWLINAVPS